MTFEFELGLDESFLEAGVYPKQHKETNIWFTGIEAV
jgi:hypothetical protein